MIETSFGQDKGEKLMVEQRKKLHDIKSEHAHSEIFDLFWSDKMSESNTYISSESVLEST